MSRPVFTNRCSCCKRSWQQGCVITRICKDCRAEGHQEFRCRKCDAMSTDEYQAFVEARRNKPVGGIWLERMRKQVKV